MDEAAVAQAIKTLQAQDKEPSIGNLRKVMGGGSLRDITKHRRKLLPDRGRVPIMDTAPVAEPPAPTPVAPGTLLQQAEQALRQALVEERRIRRGLAEPGTPITWDDLSRCSTGAGRRKTRWINSSGHRRDCWLRSQPPGSRPGAPRGNSPCSKRTRAAACFGPAARRRRRGRS